jgi:GNAT superfamily N-acetyltransferase
MLAFHAVAVTDEPALTLLAEYVDERAGSFPPQMGMYRASAPVPQHFSPPRGVFLVVTDSLDDRTPTGNVNPVGCGGVRLIAHSAGVTRFEVKHLYLQPAARGRGIGRALLDELEARARAFGASEIVLDTNAVLESAGGLYRSSGY